MRSVTFFHHGDGDSLINFLLNYLWSTVFVSYHQPTMSYLVPTDQKQKKMIDCMVFMYVCGVTAALVKLLAQCNIDVPPLSVIKYELLSSHSS